MFGMLPQSLNEPLKQVNGIKAALDSAEKSIFTDYGDQLRLWFNDWMAQYRLTNPQADEDLRRLGASMFEETVPTAIYSKLFFGDFFSTIE